MRSRVKWGGIVTREESPKKGENINKRTGIVHKRSARIRYEGTKACFEHNEATEQEVYGI